MQLRELGSAEIVKIVLSVFRLEVQLVTALIGFLHPGLTPRVQEVMSIYMFRIKTLIIASVSGLRLSEMA